MPPRFLQRMQRQSAVYREVFGEPAVEPPPYPSSHSSPDHVDAIASKRSRRLLNKALPVLPPPPYRADPNTPPATADYALPRNSLVLVTGASGFQGSHVVDELLKAGYRVRGTVRTAEKAIWTAKLFGERYGPGRYTTAIIPDMTVKGAFDIAMRNCTGVIHCASVMTLSTDPQEVIIPTIAGALNALEAAAKEPQMKRFVYCSATAAATRQSSRHLHRVTSASWNMDAVGAAWAPPPYVEDKARDVFASSKVQTEQAVWRWYEQRRPRFVLNAVLPSTLYGPLFAPKTQALPASLKPLSLVVSTDKPAVLPPHHYISVRDSALLHLCALLLPDVRKQRIFAVAGPYIPYTLLMTLHHLAPTRRRRRAHTTAFDQTFFAETSQAAALLARFTGRHAWIGLEECLRETLQSLMAR